MECVIFDLDSTLAGTRHRRAFLPADPKLPRDWIDYHSRCSGDAPLSGRIELARLLSQDYDIVIVTARPDAPEVREPTTEWLDANSVPHTSVVFMPLDEARHPSEWKVAVVRALGDAGINVVIVVDNDLTTGMAMERAGVPFLHVTSPGVRGRDDVSSHPEQ